MGEQDNNNGRTLILVAVIGAVGALCAAFFTFIGTIGSSYINNIDKFRQEKNKEEHRQNPEKK